jgi:hypothetical protein
LDENDLRDEVDIAGKAIFGPNSPPFGELCAKSKKTPMVACYID